MKVMLPMVGGGLELVVVVAAPPSHPRSRTTNRTGDGRCRLLFALSRVRFYSFLFYMFAFVFFLSLSFFLPLAPSVHSF